MDVATNSQPKTETVSDLYFLIYKFLSCGPLKNTLETFIKEINDCKILPKRIDWKGNEHDRTIEDMAHQFANLPADFLLQLCCKVGMSTANSEKGVSLLGLNKKLSGNDVENNFRQLSDYVTRRYMMPIYNRMKRYNFNLVNVMRGQEISGALTRHWIVSPKLYSSLQIQRRTLGHLSAVYCTLFDHTGKYIITGADDLLIKLWSTLSGRLIATFRGASSEITDLAINIENTLLAAGSMDRVLRIWNLQSGVPVAVLSGHTGMITSVNFCPTPAWNLHYLISTSTDGTVAFWAYCYDSNDKVSFGAKPTMYQEKMRPGQAQMTCSSFSPGGTFLAAGSADHHVRVYYMKGDEGPHRILETKAHSDRVDSIQWAHSGLKFLSGSKDGTAIVWSFETQQWKTLYLHMASKFSNASKKVAEDIKKLKVTMVNWNLSDNWVVTAVSDHSLIIWNAHTGELEKVLTGHIDIVYVLESHPQDEHVILSAGHDGQLFVWDLLKGEIIFRFINTIEGQGYGAIFDVKWSPRGNVIAATDSHGHLLIFGFGTGSAAFQKLPKELFFHTDYRPLVRDVNNYVLDEQTQVPPHLMPPPFLVDIDGNPYPPILQRLVPGREQCNMEQLVPSIVLGNGGTQEVIQALNEEHPRPENSRIFGDYEQIGVGLDIRNNSLASTSRRTRDVEGIRQSTGDWQSDPNMKWKKYILVPHLKYIEIKKAKDIVELIEKMEMSEYHKQMCQRPHMICVTTTNDILKVNEKKKSQTSYRTRLSKLNNTNRAIIVPNISSESSVHEDSEFTDSSGYSDWEADENVNVEPAKRTRRKQVNYSSDSEGHKSESDVNDEAGHSKEASPPLQTRSTRNNIVTEMYKSEWLMEVRPRKAPYFPQMGDEVVYFIQGHHLYLSAVRTKKIYEINNKNLPWAKVNLRGHEFVKVVGIQYEIKPPRVCCLKLAMLDEEGRLTGKMFTVKYHDMPDVLDFFVLKQNFEIAISRNWQVGDKFRCMIDDEWWFGEVVSKSCINEDFRDSPFMCYEIKWDNGEHERMSPWDMEPIDDDRIPENFGDALPVLEEEIESILYQPTDGDWPNNDREEVTKNILSGLLKVMELSIAEPFLVPVDLNVYPTYASIIEYPIDLSTIKSRFENRFYRRITAAQFDIRYLAANAEKFNERHSVIVKHARILTELCLRIIKNCTSHLDVNLVYHQLIDTYDSTDTEVDVEILPSNSRMLRSLPSRYFKHASDWKLEAKSLLEAIWDCEDSVPFRTPVNSSKYTDYCRIIKNPMDLSTVKEKLLNNRYETPNEFCSDMRLIFINSRTYNTNKRSRIYVMTVRLAAIFEEHIIKMIQNWKLAKRRNNNRNGNSSKSANESDTESSSAASNSSDNNKNRLLNSSDDSDDDMPLKNLQRTINQKSSSSSSSASSNSSFKKCSDDSEDSGEPKRSKRKRPKRNNLFSSEECSSSDNSDDKPLSLQVIRSRLRLNKKKVKLESDYTNSSGDEENDYKNNCVKNFTSVSSRGRVRKLTPRARALMKK